MATRTVSIAEVFDRRGVTSYQVWICFLCFCVTVLDGYDLMVIGVTMPRIAQFLKATPSALGLAVGAGQIGPLVGALVLGTLADRLGRKRMLVISALVFGIFTVLTTQITSIQQLAICRFLAGVGLGGAIPNALAFGCEYAPSRLRASLTTTMYAGMAVGSTITGLLGASILPTRGWQMMFLLGGIPPLVIALLVGLFLPESLAFLVKRGGRQERVRKILSHIDPETASDANVEYVVPEKKLGGVPVKHLFTEGRAFTTITLWVLFFLSFYLLWILAAWAPTLLRKSGATIQQSSNAFALINIGSFIATITIGRLMDRFDPFRTLKIAFVIAFFSVVVFGMSANSSFLVVAVLSVVMGFFVIGGNSGLMALATVSYPVDIRGSGVGWAYAIGKIGSMLAPVTGGMMLGWSWSVKEICSTNAIAALLVTAAVWILQSHLASVKKQQAEAAKAGAV
jgi:AAHS family 4-hydroxybenzoate transporter-like MFS transporter